MMKSDAASVGVDSCSDMIACLDVRRICFLGFEDVGFGENTARRLEVLKIFSKTFSRPVEPKCFPGLTKSYLEPSENPFRELPSQPPPNVFTTFSECFREDSSWHLTLLQSFYPEATILEERYCIC